MPSPQDTIYLDHAATSPMKEELGHAFVKYQMRYPYNASTVYEPALEVKRVFEDAIKDLQTAFKTTQHSCVFTSGGTEGNNSACHALAEARTSGVLWCSATAHPSMLETAEAMRGRGWTVISMPTTTTGVVDLNELEGLEKPDLVAFEWVNSEVGFVQPMEALCHLAETLGAKTWVDGVQGVGKLPLVALDKIHAFVFSGHKCGAPIGIGGLLLHKKVKSTPFLLGGGQQGGYRSGTLPVPLILTLRDAVVSALSLRPELLPWPSELKRHRSTDADYSPCIHLVDVAPVDGEIILHQLAAEGILVGLGSACRAARKKPSKVHKALGLSDQQSRQTLRLSTPPDFDPATWSKALERLLAIKTESARYYR